MSKIRKIYFARLIGRIILLIIVFAMWLKNSPDFRILEGWSIIGKFSVLHVLWGIWIFDMLWQLFPIKGYISLGSQKHFLMRFKPIAERINYEALKSHIAATTRSAYKVFILWAALILSIAICYWNGLLERKDVFLFSVFFYVCDLICVLIWCPFRLIMKNRCCTTCRIFNWDHLMMFSPYMLIPSLYTMSLLIPAFIVWVLWECCVMMYPERFWEHSNEALKCENCTDKLCTQYCRKLKSNNNK